VVLDLKLPGISGKELCREFKSIASSVPIVVLSANAEVEDKVLLLELGADDYVTKPFSPRELLARIRAVLRRYHVQVQAPSRVDDKRRAFRFAGWELNLRTRKLFAPDGRKLEIGNGEFNLLAAFCSAPQRVLSREQLLGLSRLNDAEVYDRAIDVQISRLRHKIEANPSRPKVIVTERGAGYVFNVLVETLF
jgi:DNA-binding response OmpR family regulator